MAVSSLEWACSGVWLRCTWLMYRPEQTENQDQAGAPIA
jgi:hypothetical protein